MGNGHSIFGSPEVCDGCGSKVPHICKWEVVYENIKLDKYKEFKPEYIFDAIKVGNEELDKIKQIVGKVRCSYGVKLDMRQRLCEECYSNINLDQLPTEWGYVAYYYEPGYEYISLP